MRGPPFLPGEQGRLVDGPFAGAAAARVAAPGAGYREGGGQKRAQPSQALQDLPARCIRVGRLLHVQKYIYFRYKSQLKNAPGVRVMNRGFEESAFF